MNTMFTIIFFTLALSTSLAFADHEVGTVWRIGSGGGGITAVEHSSSDQACEAAFAFHTVPSTSTFVAFNHRDVSEERVECRYDLTFLRFGQPVETIAAYNTASSLEVPLEHEDSFCDTLTGQTVDIFGDGSLPAEGCANSCSIGQSGVGVEIGGTYLISGVYDGTQCVDGVEGTSWVNSSQPDVTNYLEEDGSITQLAFEEPPPEDVEPEIEGVQPPVVINEIVAATETLTVYEQREGGEILIVIDEDGNVTFTDRSPTSGSGEYAAGSTIVAGGTTDGTGTETGGGSDGGTTSGTTTGGSPTGTTTAGTGGEDSEESVAGGGTCDAAPSCSGSAINCAILIQTYNTRCETEEFKELFEEEIEEGEVAESSGGQEILEAIEETGEALKDFNGVQTQELIDAGNFEQEGLDLLGRFPNRTGCDFSTLNTTLMGAPFDAGTGMCEAIEPYRQTAGFVLWAVTAFGIWTLFMNSITRGS